MILGATSFRGSVKACSSLMPCIISRLLTRGQTVREPVLDEYPPPSPDTSKHASPTNGGANSTHQHLRQLSQEVWPLAARRRSSRRTQPRPPNGAPCPGSPASPSASEAEDEDAGAEEVYSADWGVLSPFLESLVSVLAVCRAPAWFSTISTCKYKDSSPP